ncbi:MAG: hypothetical protein JSU86_06610 [Phycisphaerales bacterium]|nr:MAG: hypothetical protein JSU86_06610 [Phycisphaerales bacterium]
MVAKSDLVAAAHAIDDALQMFVHHGAAAKVFVFETEWGHLRALVGSDEFKGVSLGDRQEMIWEHLRKHVRREYLVHLYGVHPMDLEEYDAHTEEV